MHSQGSWSRGRPSTPRRRSLVAIASLAVIASSCFLCPTCPRPGSAFVPERSHRSPDLALPLDDLGRAALIGWLAALPPNRDPADEPDAVKSVEATYGKLADALRQPLSIDDVWNGLGVARQADDPQWIMTVHDARAEEQLDDRNSAAIVRGDHVFAFYAQRFVRDGASCWTLGPQVPGRFTGLVVFRKTTLVPRASP